MPPRSVPIQSFLDRRRTMGAQGPKYTKGAVERAGKILARDDVSDSERESALDILEYWKASFQEPLDEMITFLRGLTASIEDAVVIGRIKRNPAIIDKLRRNGNTFSLRTMDDIAGCRVILPSTDVLYEICRAIESSSLITSGKSQARDYVASPKEDGYRSVHFVTFHNAPSYGYKRLHCETQVRTKLQHAWSTALETYDTVNRSSLKVGGGNPKERRLFACISGLFAQIESCARVPFVPENRKDLVSEIEELEKRCGVVARLRAASESVSILSKIEGINEDALCLLDIDYADQSTRIFAFPPEQHEAAQSEYAKRERERVAELDSAPLRDVLLVRVSSARALTDAYPNYSTDIAFFLDAYAKALG